MNYKYSSDKQSRAKYGFKITFGEIVNIAQTSYRYMVFVSADE